jgi:hypothetical protein
VYDSWSRPTTREGAYMKRFTRTPLPNIRCLVSDTPAQPRSGQAGEEESRPGMHLFYLNIIFIPENLFFRIKQQNYYHITITSITGTLQLALHPLSSKGGAFRATDNL